MIRITTFAGKTVAVFGLGLSGLASCRALAAGGARVLAWDDNGAGREAASAAGFEPVDLAQADWSSIAALVLAPGVPLTHPEPHWVVQKARAAGAAIIGDIELFLRECAASGSSVPVIAITGTNGKSTTTALIAHLLAAAGRDVQMGGNIGRAILSLDPPLPGRTYVIELSSFQIDLTPSLASTVGVMLNVTPDHLDRHGTLQQYAAIKEQVAATADTAVIGVDDEFSRAMAERLAHQGRDVLAVSVRGSVPRGVAADGTDLLWCEDGKRVPFASIAGLASLRGTHNAQNAAAASAVVRRLGVADADIQRGLASFPGLAHRLEQVGRVGRVLFVNDSKATNADSTEKALASFERDIFWILGGLQKEGGISGLTSYFPRIARAYLIGAASDAFAATLGQGVPFERAGTLDNAIAAAARDAAGSQGAEPVVLLSPAGASYDQFRNVEVRGDAFRALVTALPGCERRASGQP
ncbi:MAG: UDP-N-acetylmuramoyl-L-alanine--D-glutamate ligase [Hyphomicrobiaceae bacterium]